jgi:hypothetical protein
MKVGKCYNMTKREFNPYPANMENMVSSYRC